MGDIAPQFTKVLLLLGLKYFRYYSKQVSQDGNSQQ